MSDDHNHENHENLENYESQVEHMLRKIQLLQYNNHYRMGDVIYHKGKRWKKSTKVLLKRSKKMKHTILRQYIKACPHQNLKKVIKAPRRARIFKKIINQKITSAQPLPTSDELVIHLRAGDVVVLPQFLNQDYVKIIESYREEQEIRKCTFCVAFNYGNYKKRNLWVFDQDKHQQNMVQLRELFLNLLQTFPEISFDIQSHADIDLDFIYMVKATHFVSDFGGFSHLINEIRTHIH